MVVLEKFKLWVSECRFNFMVLRGPNMNITGVILVIDVIKVANEFFILAGS